MDVDEFVETNAPKDDQESFQLENGKLLYANVDGTVLAKAGSMVAF